MRYTIENGYEPPWSSFYESLKIELTPLKYWFKEEDLFIREVMESEQEI